MDLSVFLILLFVTLQFVAEYRDWSQLRVKLGIFIATLGLTLPNIIFMVIDWWQSPHSKMALLVLNTFKPILRGETYRLFRWLKSIGIGLTSDELNYLPISNPCNTSDFFVTRECFLAFRRAGINNRVIPEDEELPGTFPYMLSTRCTAFLTQYENETIFVHQVKFSRKLQELSDNPTLTYEDFVSHHLFKSSLIRSATFKNLDISTAKHLIVRLKKIIGSKMPILENFDWRREWLYFHAASTLDYLNEDLVLLQGDGESIAMR